MNDTEQRIRELAEKAAAILHHCDHAPRVCAMFDLCKRDRAYLADTIEQEVTTPLLSQIEEERKRIAELEADNAELRGIISGVQDVAAGNTRSFADIQRNLRSKGGRDAKEPQTN